jgi:hypothetical protein
LLVIIAILVRPLNDYLPPTRTKKGTSKYVPNRPFHWGDEQQSTFDVAKDALSNPPVLGFADFSLPFELHTDMHLLRVLV